MPRIVEVRKDILKKNDLLAADLRSQFLAHRLSVINLVSSPAPERPRCWRRRFVRCRNATLSRRWSAISRPIATLNGCAGQVHA